MSDNYDSLQSNSSEAPASERKRNPLLIIGGVGCLLLLCIAFSIGGAALFLGDQIQSTFDDVQSELENSANEDQGSAQVSIGATDEPAERRREQCIERR